MKTWAILYNFFAVLILSFMCLVLYRDLNENSRQLEEIRLKYAVDYATEASFMSALEGSNLGITYKDLQSIRAVPENTLPIFKALLLSSYDMGFSSENFEAMDNYISGAVLAVADGYYIASPNVDNNSKLTWGLKKPYTVRYSNSLYVAYNLSNQKWVLAQTANNEQRVVRGESWQELRDGRSKDNVAIPALETTTTDDFMKEKVITTINKRISDDLNFNFKERKKYFTDIDGVRTEDYQYDGKIADFVYLPSGKSVTGVNSITKPSILITLSDVDFTGVRDLDMRSVGGLTVSKKRRVVGFVESGKKYYCYEGQLANTTIVDSFFNTLDEAAKEGYNPQLNYLEKAYKD